MSEEVVSGKRSGCYKAAMADPMTEGSWIGAATLALVLLAVQER